MAAFQFPDTPTVNQSVTGAGGIVYVWDGVKWISGLLQSAQGGAYIGTTPPASPVAGQLWFDESVFKLFIRYSGTWIGLN